MPCKCAKEDEMVSGARCQVSGAGDQEGKAAQERQCKCAKVNVSGLVGEWTSGLGREEAVPLKLD